MDSATTRENNRVPVSVLVAAYTTLQPLAAGSLAAVFLGERLGWPQAMGGLLIAAGLWRVSTAPARSGGTGREDRPR